MVSYDRGARFGVCGMPVIGGERFAVREVADEREIGSPFAGVEASPDLDPEQPGNAADLRFERCANRRKICLRRGFQPPQHDMPHHRR
ncbi:MAG TPA: hypothetical protein VLI89_16675 [Burkholderiales bacterium]|nr:hypothetical protein [Burkholderiales bacterium]